MQEEILERVLSKLDLWQLLHLVIDFDSQTNVMRFFGVQKQSTLIVFRGAKDVGRSVGDTNEGRIERLLRASL